ncbi:MBL fold metallo-hydrolase [Pseudonocardia spinosispora]|uniref:MBL fold metallo-hydrolase n=1 Tax=Pseudonocardia spinosispora TaxID=103441 RepID=UPI00040364C7|nr:MBL fold metallo-hydrolase [Pseudonocardia spinosispora]
MRIHHLNCGTMRPLGGTLFDGNPGVLRRAEMVCHVLLLETEDGLALIDTGIGTQATSRPNEWLGRSFCLAIAPTRDRAESAVEQIVRLGLDPADVRHIVLTHLDLDHAGGLADFPDAVVHIYSDELDAMQSPRNRAEKERYRPQQFAHGPKFRAYRTEGDPWFGFDAVRELDGLGSDVLIVPLVGHSRGHAGVAVRNGDGWVLSAGDSYFFHGELEAAPSCPPGIAVFETLMQAQRGPRVDNQNRLRTLVAEHGAEVSVFSAHSSTEFSRSLAKGA